MADTFQFDLVSPESRLASGPAKAVRLPGTDGDMTAMPDHAPTVTTLRPGTIVVEMADGSEQAYVVLGGFAQITADSATVLADEAMRLSLSGAFVGSPLYASPEHFRTEELDGRADLFSLGVILYELASGAHPHPGDDFASVLARVTNDRPRHLGERKRRRYPRSPA